MSGRIAAAMMLSLSLGVGVATSARADLPLWELGLGLGALRVPHYRGSEQSHSWLLPVPYVVYRGEIFRSDREGTRAVLLDTAGFDLDLSLIAGPPASSADNRARTGMPDLAPTVEIGPQLKLMLAKGAYWKLDLRAPLRAAFALRSADAALGWTATPVLNLEFDVDGWNIGLQGGPLAASRRNHAYFYEVAPAYAAATRPAYRAANGFAGWGATAAASRRLGDWWLAAYLRGDSVAGATFAGSPLVTQRNNLSMGVAASWVFKVSDERVADRR